MQLTNPIGLLALAGLIIPVLIHLWNVKQGKTIKIGSIALLGENAAMSSKSFKLTDLLLFVLRCLLLMLIAFMLAQPYLKKTKIATKNKGWVLMDKSQLADVYRTHRNTIDSLLINGFELHDFNQGFTKFSLNDSVEPIQISSRLKYNSLLNQLNKEIPSGYSAYLFADHKLNNFDENLPQLNFKLVWKDVVGIDTVSTWSTTFLNKVYHAKSTPNLTNYSTDQQQALPVIKVMIRDPKGIDSRYIKAALYATSNFTKRKIEIVKLFSEADLIFWLSDEPIPLNGNKQGVRLFSYQYGKAETVNSIVQIIGEPNQTIELKKRIVFDGLKGAIIWADGYGNPILIKNKHNHFHFYSHFNPQWTDLVWDEQFVKALLPIVLGNENEADFGFENHAADQRVFGKTLFAESKNNTSGFLTTHSNQNLDYMLWILAFVVIIVERALSFKHKNRNDVKR